MFVLFVVRQRSSCLLNRSRFLFECGGLPPQFCKTACRRPAKREALGREGTASRPHPKREQALPVVKSGHVAAVQSGRFLCWEGSPASWSEKNGTKWDAMQRNIYFARYSAVPSVRRKAPTSTN